MQYQSATTETNIQAWCGPQSVSKQAQFFKKCRVPMMQKLLTSAIMTISLVKLMQTYPNTTLYFEKSKE